MHIKAPYILRQTKTKTKTTKTNKKTNNNKKNNQTPLKKKKKKSYPFSKQKIIQHTIIFQVALDN